MMLLSSRPFFHSSLLALWTASLVVGGDVVKFDEIPFFDFTDEYYLSNGVDPSLIPNRVNPPGIATVDTSPDPDNLRDVRVLLTIPGYDHSGHPVYISVFGEFGENAFTPDAAGAEAREIADDFPLYIFPCAALADPTALPPPCKRQDDIIPFNDGYFSNDPLGLWLLVFVLYTDDAFNTQEGVDVLAKLGQKNGLDLDGTPLVKTLSELEDLKDKGLVDFILRPVDDMRWSVCPAFKDPRNGAVAPDSFLAASGADPELVTEWECLRDTGDWC